MRTTLQNRTPTRFIPYVGLAALVAFAGSSAALVIWAPTSSATPPPATARTPAALPPPRPQAAPARDPVQDLRQFTADLARSSDLSMAKENLRGLLRDPESAEFQNVIEYHTKSDGMQSGRGYIYCGEINAKTVFGGYAGFERFIAGPGRALLEHQAATPAWSSYFETRWSRDCDVYGGQVTFSLRTAASAGEE